MDKKQYRLRRRANSLAKTTKITVASAFKIEEAKEKVIKALAPVKSAKRKAKILQAVQLLLDES